MSSDKIVKIAGVVLRDKQGRYLLVQEKQRYVYGLWNWPAGHANEGETLEQTAVREALEETGLKIKIIKSKPLYIGQGNRDEHVVHSLLGEVISGELSIQESEILDAQWLSVDEIKKLDKEGKLRGEWVITSISKVEGQLAK